MPSWEVSTKRCVRKSSSRLTTRSVAGMKNLLPLQLSWPNSSQRSAFGSTPQEQEVSNTRIENIPDRYSKSRNRDRPVYRKPGSSGYCNAHSSPSLSLQYSPTNSSCDENSVSGYDSPNTEISARERRKSTRSMDFKEEEYYYRFLADSELSETTNESRNSGLSFQCCGDKKEKNKRISSEVDWHSTASTWIPNHECLPQVLADNMPHIRDMDSYFTDSNSLCEDDEDEELLEWATPLEPAKAQVIDVNMAHVASASVKIPLRSFSLTETHQSPLTFSRTSSWVDYDWGSPTSPIDDRVEGGYGQQSHFNEDFISRHSWGEPAAILPVMSPKTYMVDPDHHTYTPSTNNIPMPTRHTLSRFLPQHANLTDHTASVLISSLENSISDFSSAMSLHMAPSISAIRFQLHHPPDRNLPYRTIPRSASSTTVLPKGRILLPHQSTPLKRATISLSIKNSISSINHSNDNSFYSSNNIKLHHESTPPLNLDPLQRIFPESTRVIVSVLYAHIIAYIYTTRLIAATTPPISPLFNRWPSLASSLLNVPSKAASMLGIPTLSTSCDDFNDFDNDYDFNKRVENLAGKLKRCINSLLPVMKPNTIHENMVNVDQEQTTNEALFQALVEVVTNCELQSFGEF